MERMKVILRAEGFSWENQPILYSRTVFPRTRKWLLLCGSRKAITLRKSNLFPIKYSMPCLSLPGLTIEIVLFIMVNAKSKRAGWFNKNYGKHLYWNKYTNETVYERFIVYLVINVLLLKWLSDGRDRGGNKHPHIFNKYIVYEWRWLRWIGRRSGKKWLRVRSFVVLWIVIDFRVIVYQ